jgi:hypothetical protein
LLKFPAVKVIQDHHEISTVSKLVGVCFFINYVFISMTLTFSVPALLEMGSME